METDQRDLKRRNAVDDKTFPGAGSGRCCWPAGPGPRCLIQSSLPGRSAMTSRRSGAWLDEGLSPEFQGNQIGTGLMIAAWHGNIPLMSLFVERGAKPRKRANQNGEQALQLAAWNGHLSLIKWLLDPGAVINRDGNYWGALHYAVSNGHTEIARYLIGRGAAISCHFAQRLRRR